MNKRETYLIINSLLDTRERIHDSMKQVTPEDPKQRAYYNEICTLITKLEAKA